MLKTIWSQGAHSCHTNRQEMWSLAHIWHANICENKTELKYTTQGSKREAMNVHGTLGNHFNDKYVGYVNV